MRVYSLNDKDDVASLTRYDNSSGQLTISSYCPYIMCNHLAFSFYKAKRLKEHLQKHQISIFHFPFSILTFHKKPLDKLL